MTFHVLTFFPELFSSFLGESIIKRALVSGKVAVHLHNIRKYATDKHHKADDRPYGGGPGMVMIAQPILHAVEAINGKDKSEKRKVIILSPRGKKFTNGIAQQLVDGGEDIILICGRYEGIDARVRKILKAEEVSIGPYTLTGGEVPAMVMIDAITRRLPGVLGNNESVEEKRTAARSVYTRPGVLEWRGRKHRVPKVLLSGHHDLLETWRKKH